MLLLLGLLLPRAAAAQEMVDADGVRARVPEGYARSPEAEDQVRRLAAARGELESYRLIVLGRVDVDAELPLARFRELMEGQYPTSWRREADPAAARVAGLPAEESRFSFEAGGILWRHDFLYFIAARGHCYAELVAPDTAYAEARGEFESFVAGITVAPPSRPPGAGAAIADIAANPAAFAGSRAMVTGRLLSIADGADGVDLRVAGRDNAELLVTVPGTSPFARLARDLPLPVGETLWAEGTLAEDATGGAILRADRVGPATHEPAFVDDVAAHPGDYVGVPLILEGEITRNQGAVAIAGPGGAAISISSAPPAGGPEPADGADVAILGRLRVAPTGPILDLERWFR